MKNCIPSLEYQVIHKITPQDAKIMIPLRRFDAMSETGLWCGNRCIGTRTQSGSLSRPTQRIFCKIKTMDLSFNHFNM